mmetsp:Transcript_12306/g.23357  ORF Transcript_12306/g.23357 Transcript_12306/m.23357 type:complete len:200 (-) Transcript_12306:487-1086(-)
MELDYNLSDLDLSTDIRSSDDFDYVPCKRLKVDADEAGYVPGTNEYKKARKRRQNRESAARSRARKRQEVQHLDTELDDVKKVNKQLMQQNATLKTENELLKKELEFFRSVFQVEAPKPQLKRAGYTTSFLAVSLLCMVACMCLFMPSTAGGEPNLGSRRLLLLSDDTKWDYGFLSFGWLLVPLIAASAWYRRARRTAS